MEKPLRIALTKGRLEKDTIGLLESLGFDCTAVREKGRKLILPIPDANLEVVLAKAADVITYVEHGVCDMGVVGKDTIMEMNGKFYELVDLGFGKCKFALAGKKGDDFYAGIGVKGDLIADLTEDLAAEQKARVTYDNILRLSDDPDVNDVIKFLRAREIVHFQRFGEGLRLAKDKMNEKNLYFINPSFDK